MLKWVLIGVFALGAIATVLMIDREREPITHGTAAVVVTLDVLLIIGILLSY